jgi:hypothetical protein
MAPNPRIQENTSEQRAAGLDADTVAYDKRDVAKAGVGGSNPLARSRIQVQMRPPSRRARSMGSIQVSMAARNSARL